MKTVGHIYDMQSVWGFAAVWTNLW